MFHIKSIKIDWCEHLEFKGPLTLTPGINLIIGKNGSGKTSVLKMIEAIRQGQNKGLSGVDEQRFKDQQELVKIECQDSAGTTQVITGVKGGSALNWNSVFVFNEKIRFITSDRRVNLQTAANSIIPNINRDIAIPEPGVEIDVSLEFTSAILKDLFEKIDQTINNTTIAKDVIDDYRNGLIDFEKSIEMDLKRTSNPIFFKDYRGKEAQVWDLSSGEKEYLYFYAFLRRIRADENRVILIDEPELHLHSSQIKKLCEMISELGKKNQVIIATHSPEVMQHFIDSNIVLISRGEVKNIQSNEDLKGALTDIGLPMDPSIFTSRWICAENEPLKKLKGGGPTTPELLCWIFGNSIHNKFWSFGSRGDRAEALINGVEQVSTSQTNIRLTAILDGDKKCKSPDTFGESNTTEIDKSNILYWNFWELENILLFPDLINALIPEKDGRTGVEIFWNKVKENKESLFSSIHKTVLKNYLRQSTVDKIIKSNPQTDFETWKASVMSLSFDHEALKEKFNNVVENKQWEWVPGKECLDILLTLEPRIWEKLAALQESGQLKNHLEKQAKIKGTLDKVLTDKPALS